MTSHAVPAQVTEDYRAERSSGAPRESVRVALVAGSGSVVSDDLYALLLRRLRVSSLIAAVGLGVFFGELLFAIWYVVQTGQMSLPEVTARVWAGFTLRGVAGIVSVVAAGLLWLRPPSSVRGLRLIELLVVGLFGAVLVADGVLLYGKILTTPAVDELLVRRMAATIYALGVALMWFCLITWYGALIPNTRRRSMVVVGILAVTPLVAFAIQGLWLRPLPADIKFVPLLLAQAIFIGVASAIAIFSSSRIEILRQKVAEARKLGQYVLKEKLGSGGMGEVYRAEHVLLRRPCALKVIRPERAGDPRNLHRFEREVQVTATLTHPNTVQIFDYGHTEDGTFYYVMEYLPGQNLEEMVKETGPLPPERAVHLLRQVCDALREAHAAGLIHRDIKPSNIIVCERGGRFDVAKLLDFGIVDAADSELDGELTGQGQLLGTPPYMSAEQAAGMPELDARSDLYSLGATAYFMLTGKAPFERATPNLVIAAHLRDPATPPHYLRTTIPTDLSAVVTRCLEKDPTQRYADAAGLENALGECKCAGQWSEERAAQANQLQTTSGGEPRISTTELERQWGF